MENLTLCKMVIPENLILKLGTRNCVEELTYYTIFGVDRQRPARTARPILTLYGSNDVVPPKDGPFWG